MPRYAIIANSIVENIIVADDVPTFPSRTVVPLSAGQAVSPGDTYSAGVFAPRVPTPTKARYAAAVARLVGGRPQLRALRDQATANTGITIANVAQAQTAIRQIAVGMATLAQNILDLELVAASHQDDGSD